MAIELGIMGNWEEKQAIECRLEREMNMRSGIEGRKKEREREEREQNGDLGIWDEIEKRRFEILKWTV